jgi:hypothetical protein
MSATKHGPEVELNMFAKAARHIGDLRGHDYHGGFTNVAISVCHKCGEELITDSPACADDLNRFLKPCREAAKPTRYDEMIARQKEKS